MALGALGGLEPQELERARKQFTDSPPQYISDQSGTATRSQSQNSRDEEQRVREERRIQLAGEREASKPDKQFAAEIDEGC